MDLITARNKTNEACQLIEEYRQGYIGKDPIKNNLINETKKRLEKIEYILSNCYELDDEIQKISQLTFMWILNNMTTPDPSTDTAKYLLRLEVYTETFYYNAFRIFKILQSLKLNIKCLGVVQIRNHLLEHPEVLSQSFGTGNMGNGPTI